MSFCSYDALVEKLVEEDIRFTYRLAFRDLNLSHDSLFLLVSFSGQLHYSIAEELRKDSVIANIANDLGLDTKELKHQRFCIVSRVSEKYFSIDLENGNLYIKDRIDREILCGAAPNCFLTFDAMVANPINVFPVTIEIQDINDNPPVFFHETVNLEMIELTLPETRFVLQTAEDPDIGSNSVQTYKLSDNQYFTLSEKTSSDGSTFPELVLEKALDREKENTLGLILTASDGGNPVKTGTLLIRVVITDANDNFPVFSKDVYKTTVNENMPVNSTVISVTASDKDEGTNAQITYSVSKTTNNALHVFSINPFNGEIKIQKHLDYEATQNYELAIQAKDGGGLVAHCKVLVEVMDENDNEPEINFASLFSPIPEHSIAGTVIALIEVHDQDSGENGEVDCHLTDSADFQLISSTGRFYRIVTTNNLDRERTPFYNITILATDRGYPQRTSKKMIGVEISDVNDNAPLFIKPTYDAFLPENNLPGALIYSLHAKDLDVGDNAKVTYSILNTNTDFSVSSYFSINIETGVLYAQRTFDFEVHKEFLIQVLASDNGSPPLSSNATLIIHITDQNDNTPTILYPPIESGGSTLFEMVPFASEQGSLITKVVAVDADSGHNSWLSFHFIQLSETSPFTISQHTGEIRTSRTFQEKDVLKYKLVVMVKDNGQPPLSATVTLSLVVADTFHAVVPKLKNNSSNEDSQSNMQFYLVIALAVISLLFIITLMMAVVSKYKQSKSTPVFSSFGTTFYSDSKFLNNYTNAPNGTLTFPQQYNVCVALDPSESEFTFLKANQSIPTDNLIDADDSGLRNENITETLPPNYFTQMYGKP
eukprot:XP_017948107.1 PREDICTED: protocadherin gamma-B5-like [Xenopus tropicalis]